MKPSISIGIVGVGQFGTAFVELFKKHPNVRRVALCDINAPRLADCARRFGITETYASLDDACRSDLDALAIITQPWLHAPQAIQAMQSGKHAYSAVPIIMPQSGSGDETLDWCDKLIEAARHTGQRYMMGETTYYRPETVMCRKKYAEGAFGQVVFVESEYLHDTWSPSCNLIEVQMARTGLSAAEVIRRGGDAPMHYPTHSTSAPIAVLNAHMTEVTAFGYVHPNDELFRPDSITGNLFSNEMAQFRMSNGAVVKINEGRRIGHSEHEGIVRIIGTDASYERETTGDDQNPAGVWITKSSTQSIDARAYRDPLPDALAGDLGGHGGSHAYLVHEFVMACCEDRQPTVNAWQSARYVAAGVMAHKSALCGGELLKVPDWGDAPDA